MREGPETRIIDVGYIDPMDRAEYELARSEWDQERADRRRDAEEDRQVEFTMLLLGFGL